MPATRTYRVHANLLHITGGVMPSPSDWRSPDTAPTNGCEFEYLTTDGEIKRGSLASDCGGVVKRDSRMVGWRCVSAAIGQRSTPKQSKPRREDDQCA